MSQIRALASLFALASVLGSSALASAESTEPNVAVEVEPVEVEVEAVAVEAPSEKASNDAPPVSAKKKEEKPPREGKVAAFYAGPFLEVLGIGFGIGAGVHVTRNTLIEVDGVVAGALTWEPTGMVSTSLGVRQFVGNSFYLRGGRALPQLHAPHVVRQ